MPIGAFAGWLLDQATTFTPTKKKIPRCSQPESRCAHRPTTRPIELLGCEETAYKKKRGGVHTGIQVVHNAESDFWCFLTGGKVVA